MITVLNSYSLYVGTDMKKFNEIRDMLDHNKIQYKYKVKNQLGQFQFPDEGTVRGRTGSFGQSSDLMYEYEILIHKKDKDKAIYEKNKSGK